MESRANSKLIGILLLFLTLTLQLAANQPSFEHFTTATGLSHGQVLAIIQDDSGFMWFGTQNGLNKYAGYEFDVYRHDPQRPGTLSDSYIKDLLVDSDGYLWIATNNGLDRFDTVSEKVITYNETGKDGRGIGSNDVWTLMEDRSGTIWVGTLGGGLDRYDPASGTFENFSNDPGDPYSLSSNLVRSLAQDRFGNIWIGTQNGLNKLDPSSAKVTRYMPGGHPDESLPNPFVFSMIADSRGYLWLGTYGGGLARLDPETDRFEVFRHEEGNPHSLSGNHIWSLLEDRAGNLWIGTLDQGLNRLQPGADEFERFHHQEGDPRSLSSNKIWALFEDEGGTLWVGTGDQGLCKFSPGLRQFTHYAKNPVAESDSFLVTALLADAQDRIWIGTWESGILAFDAQGDTYEHYLLDNPDQTSQNYVVQLYEDRGGELWVGIWQRGLGRLNRDTGTFDYYHWDARHLARQSPQRQIATALLEDSMGTLWVGSFGEGLYTFDRQKEMFKTTHYNAFDPQDPGSLSNNRIITLFEDSAGTLWVGTADGGLNRREPSGTFTRFQTEPGNPDSLSNNRVTCILEDRKGRLWIGTEGGGINLFENGGFRHIRERDGLPSDIVAGMLEDDAGNLWVSTNRGLVRYDPEAETLKIYGVQDGLQFEFNAGVCTRTRDGEMFFGGVQGFNRFHPDRILRNNHVPPVVLTGFRKFQKELVFDKSPAAVRDIVLSHKDNFIGFEFAALDFTAPQKNRFAYKLEGLHDDWIDSGSLRMATFTNLDGGDYFFRVKGSNNDGVWNETGASVHITIIPPFYQTMGFKMSLGLVLLALPILGTYAWQRRRILRIERARDEVAETKRRLAEGREVERLHIAQELHDGPIQDLHALQFQLSLNKKLTQVPSALSEQVLKVIHNLRDLCGELRPPALEVFGLKSAIRAHLERIQEQHPQVTFDLHLMNDDRSLPPETKLALFRICQESLNNTLAHSHGDHIEVTFEWDAERVVLEIRDNGRGFEMKKSLVELSREGHFGLLGISERAEAIGGTLDIISQPMQGTIVRVITPRVCLA